MNEAEGLFAWIRCNHLQGGETCQDVFKRAGISRVTSGPRTPERSPPFQRPARRPRRREPRHAQRCECEQLSVAVELADARRVAPPLEEEHGGVRVLAGARERRI